MNGTSLCFPPQSLDLARALYVNPNNIEDLASFIHESATINKDNRIICFGQGQKEKFLEIPLECLDRIVPLS